MSLDVYLTHTRPVKGAQQVNLDELERLYRAVEGGYCSAPELGDALQRAFPDLLALARDGERYRWLRDRRAYVAIAPHSDHMPRNQRTGWTTRLITGNDENMDAAIDAARKGEKP